MLSDTIAALHRLVNEEKHKDIQFTISVEMFEAGRLAELPGLLDGSRFNAAIIANTTIQDDAFLAANQLSFPVILLGRDITNYSSVRDMPENTGRKAAEILLSADCKRPAVLHGALLTQATRGRLEGFSDGIRSLGAEEPRQITSEGFDERDGYEAMRQFLREDPEIDGLYAVMDTLAIGAYRAIKERGLCIPQDIAIVGAGEHPSSGYLDPPLTAFAQSQYNLQEEAARLLLARVSGEAKTHTQILIPVIPILRQSTRRGSLADQ